MPDNDHSPENVSQHGGSNDKYDDGNRKTAAANFEAVISQTVQEHIRTAFEGIIPSLVAKIAHSLRNDVDSAVIHPGSLAEVRFIYKRMMIEKKEES
jgi:hypothetical protein